MATHVGAPVIRISPSRGWVSLRLRDLWEYRELLYFLVWRDVKVRYKQTVLGAAWAIIQPVSHDGGLRGLLRPAGEDAVGRCAVPPLRVRRARAVDVLRQRPDAGFQQPRGSGNLIRKVYFPRLAVPSPSVLSGIVDFALAFAVLVVLLIWYGSGFRSKILWLPVFGVQAITTALAVALWLSALNVEYRDVRYVVPFMTQFWLFATPVAYPSSLLSGAVADALRSQPDGRGRRGFPLGAADTGAAPGPMLAVSSLASLVLLVGGAYYFRRLERTFADRV